MDTNDETKVMTGHEVNQPQESEEKQQSNKKGSWKSAAAGVASGAVAGAGAMYAANAFGADAHEADTKAEEKPDAEQPMDEKTAKPSDDTSNQDSQETADTNDDTADVHVAPTHSQDVDVVSDDDYVQAQDTSDDGDVHVVGQGYVEGHQAVAVDLTGNGEADVAIIDINDNGQLDNPDVVVDSDGNTATMGELAQAQSDIPADDGYGYTGDDIDPTADPSLQQTAYDNPDFSPDMPDYMDDADVTGQFV